MIEYNNSMSLTDLNNRFNMDLFFNFRTRNHQQ